jgi:hypothetical protein
MTLLRRSGYVLLCACLLTLAACASKPQHPGPQGIPPGGLRAAFKKADTDGDEQLTREEMKAGLPQYAEHFDEIDTDHNNLVNLSELLSYVQWKRLEVEDENQARQLRRGGR